MDFAQLHRRRLGNQRLAGSRPASAEEVVGWLGAVQAQEYPYAKWSVGQRADTLAEANLDAAVAEGRVIRTHVLRPTWHFLAAADFRWIIGLSGPIVDARNRHRYNQLGLDDATLERGKELIRGALKGGRRLTRPELGAALSAGGVDISLPQRREHIVMHAELTGLICSGGFDARRQHTYALVDEVVPAAEPLGREDALAELTRRYFASHGPAAVADFTWWSGLRVADARRGIELAGAELESITVDGTTLWMGARATDERRATDPDAREADSDGPVASLLQAFDEMIVGYRPTRTVPLDPNSMTHPIVVDGRIVGRWRRTRVGASYYIQHDVTEMLTADELHALDAEIGRCARFYGAAARGS